ncbi:MAG: rRNA pseudouridine synthase [Deltaproteobacteria bacterium]|nr:rRNA pseudouridine synthase [Deltaproteobacteria bacterium]
MVHQTERLQKILSQAGIASRRAAEELIREGRVQVNGKVIRELGAKADPVSDRITVDGRAAQPERLRYVAYHKPVGVVSTLSDPEGRPSIAQVTGRLRTHLFPVGRLDFDSSGLVLLTNDGEMAQRLAHPRYHVAKVYRVKVRGHPDEHALSRLRRGIRLADGQTAPAHVTVEGRLEHKARLRITIREGRRRQVRRMLEAVGHPVDRLSRVAIGPVRLGALPPGGMRDLTANEVRALRALVRGAPPTDEGEGSKSSPVRRRRAKAGSAQVRSFRNSG